METAKDILTGEVFYKMRNNQKFANRKNQIKYNNIIANKKRKAKSSFDKVLDKNRTVLKNILGNSKEAIKSKDFLLGAGFSFNVLTNSFQENGVLWYCVYEMAYSKQENNNFKIIQYA